MKIIIQLCICIVCFCQTIYSQDLVRYTKDGLYGFADQDGNVVIDVQYEEVTEFGVPLILSSYNYGSKRRIPSPLAHVKKDGQWKVINRKGDSILPTTSDEKFKISWLSYKFVDGSVKDFWNVLSAVKVKNETDGTWRIFYLKNEERGETIYQDWVKGPIGSNADLNPFRGGTYPDNVDRYVIASRSNVETPIEKLYGSSRSHNDASGPPGVTPIYDLINTVDGSIEIKGRKSISFIYPNVYSYSNSENNSTIYNCETKNSTELAYPILDVKIKETNSDIQPDGLARQKKNYTIEYYIIGRPGTKGLLDKNFNLVLDTLYSRIDIYSNYFVTVEGGDPGTRNYGKRSYVQNNSGERKVSLFGYSGNRIEIPEVKSLYPTSDDHFITQLKSTKYVLLDRRGRLVDDQEYDMLRRSRNISSRFMYRQGEMAGVRDLRGKVLFSYPCKELSYFNDHADLGGKYFLAKNSNEVGLVKDDSTLVFPIKYQYISLLNIEKRLLMLVDKNGLYGLADLDQNILIPFKYDNIRIDNESIPDTQTSEKHIVCFNNKKEEIRYDLDLKVVQKPIWKGKRESNFGIDGMRVLKGESRATAIVDQDDNKISDSIYYGVRHYPVGDDYIVTGIVDENVVDIYNSKGKQIAKRGAVLKSISYTNGKMKDVFYVKELNAVIVTEGETQALVNLDGEYLIPSGKYRYVGCSKNSISTTRYEDEIPYTTLYDFKLQPITKEYAHFQYLHSELRRHNKIDYMLVAESVGKNKGKLKFKYGVIDLDGKVIIPFEYDEARRAIEGVSLTKITKGERYSKYYNLKIQLVDEGAYDYYIGTYRHTKTTDAVKGDNYITIELDGSVKEKPMIYPVRDSKMIVKKSGDQVQLCDADGEIICSADLDKGMINSQNVSKLSEDRFIFQQPGMLYVLSNNGKVLAQLDCDLFWSYQASFIPYDKNGEIRYMEDLLTHEEHQELLNEKLLKISHNEEVYYYNFEKLILFKD